MKLYQDIEDASSAQSCADAPHYLLDIKKFAFPCVCKQGTLRLTDTMRDGMCALMSRKCVTYMSVVGKSWTASTKGLA